MTTLVVSTVEMILIDAAPGAATPTATFIFTLFTHRSPSKNRTPVCPLQEGGSTTELTGHDVDARSTSRWNGRSCTHDLPRIRRLLLLLSYAPGVNGETCTLLQLSHSQQAHYIAFVHSSPPKIRTSTAWFRAKRAAFTPAEIMRHGLSAASRQ